MYVLEALHTVLASQQTENRPAVQSLPAVPMDPASLLFESVEMDLQTDEQGLEKIEKP